MINEPYMTPEEKHLVLEFIQKYKPTTFLEYGIGWSTHHFSNFSFIKDYYGVEHDADWIAKMVNFVGGNVKFIHCPLFWGDFKYADKACINNYVEKDDIAPFDMIFIDGDYRWQCIEYASRSLKEGGICLVHDSARKDMHQFFKHFNYHKILTAGELNDNGDWHQGLTVLWNFEGEV